MPESKPFRIMPWRVIYTVLFSACLFVIVKQYGGWNFDAELGAYREKMDQLHPGENEQDILKRFRRIQALNRNYTIGVIAVTDHHPVFGGEDYRVYDIGYYDLDKRARPLVHVMCLQGRIGKIDRVTSREPAAPEYIDSR